MELMDAGFFYVRLCAYVCLFEPPVKYLLNHQTDFNEFSKSKRWIDM